MKKLTIFRFFIVALFVGFITLASCEKDEAATFEKEAVISKSSGPLNFSPAENSASAASLSCAENLTNDGCNFTSGTGTDMQNQFTMVNLLNGCRTESVPAGCSLTAITATRTINADLSNCCYGPASLNAQMNGWKQLAMNARPASDYIITGYTRINGFMVTAYGPYRMVISVTYRKKTCRVLPSEESIPIGHQSE
jgi:hypothetical protein